MRHKTKFLVKGWSGVRWFLRSNLLVYIIFGIIFYHVVDIQMVNERRMVEAINEIMPSFLELKRFHDTGEVLREHELDQYLKYYSLMDQAVPDSAEVHGALGLCNYYKGNQNKAIFHFKKATELNPTQFWFLYDLGVVYYKRGDYADALYFLKQAQDVDVQFTIGNIFSSPLYRRLLASVVNLGEVIEKNLVQSYNDIYVLEVEAYFRLEDFSEMGRIAREALAEGRGNKVFHCYYAGLSAYHRKDFQAAIFYLSQCIKEQPNYAEAYYYLSAVWKELGNKEKALALLQMSVALHNNQASVVLVNSDAIQLRIF